MTLFKPPRRIVVKLGNGVELIEFVPLGRFGPRIVNESSIRPEVTEKPDPPVGAFET